ncbi:hypothetical protein BVC71_09790 [Marivivens niveibacter]|uniref:Uncharacterized protein n=1 Tax=Marivivens niveibacter TaxID=1930667 RepID=A0A251WX40_9RHOB|nr:hypothetical protein [Marivivens niveibacter]OUD08997.1 hypothetical protein BVC71_09790 [Marivivens niveibacter]
MFNFNKTAVLAAFATIATAGAAAASSDAYFGVQNTVDAGDEITIEYVNAPAAGEVQIYGYNADGAGQLLGNEEVFAGGNINTDIELDLNTYNKVLAVLTVDGADLASEVLYVK